MKFKVVEELKPNSEIILKIITYDDFKKFKDSNEDEWCKLRQDK